MLNPTNGLQAEPVLRHGNLWNAAKEIGVDLIVIGSHGHTRLGTIATWEHR